MSDWIIKNNIKKVITLSYLPIRRFRFYSNLTINPVKYQDNNKRMKDNLANLIQLSESNIAFVKSKNKDSKHFREFVESLDKQLSLELNVNQYNLYLIK